MFSNHRHHAGLSQDEHRALPFVSNTDLTTTKNQALGISRLPNPQALAFGSHFHTAVLEPDHYQRTPQRLPWDNLEQLATAVRRQRYCRDLLYRGQPEQTYTATHTATGLVVKVRPDLLLTSPKTGRRVLVDFKTTSSPDYAHFCTTIEKYDYDRQAAMYSDLLGAARFLIIGVQKKAPFEVWRFEVMPAPGLLAQGRKKYERLLRAHAQQPSRPVLLAAPGHLVHAGAAAYSRA